MKEDVKFFDTFFLMGLPEREKVAEWLELACAETEAQEDFLRRVTDALEVVDYDYYIATLEPSFHNGEIVYSKGELVATGLTGREWVKKAQEYFSSNSWKSSLATLHEGDLFKAYRVAMGYWSLEYICDDSSAEGNYLKVDRLHHDMAATGEFIVGGFADGVGNSFEVYRDKGGIALVGGAYMNLGFLNPVTRAFRFYPDAKIEHGRGVLVIKQN